MFLELIKNNTDVRELIHDNESVYYFCDKKMFSNNSNSIIIGEFKKVNFFIGSNNSGKSRFLRGLIKNSATNEIPLNSNKNFTSVIDLIKPDDYLKNVHFIQRINNNSQFHNHINVFLSKILNENLSSFDLINNSHIFENLYKANDFFIDELNNFNDEKQVVKTLLNFTSRIKDLEILTKYSKENIPTSKIYIPTLRNLTRNSNLQSDTFNTVVKENFNIEKNVFTGLKIYEDLSEKKGSPIAERKKVQEFEKFLSKTFFDNKRVEITASKVKPATILFSIDENEYPIYDIGDGIQMLIILLFPIFTANDNTWFFIEEPETHLHPGLQRIFIETILNDEYLVTKKLRYFFTTHSNHFLDLSLQTNDVSIFQFHKENEEKFNIKNVKPNKETLDLLGVNNSSVLMANASIWIEGPTDRKYISKFLKQYCEKNISKHLKEDIDFAFFEYGGNLIEHYLFDESFDEIFTEEEVKNKINSFAISNKIYLLADNDNAKGKKLARRKKLIELSEKEKNFKYQNTTYREIENLLPVNILKDFLNELVKPLHIEKIKNIQFNRKDYISIGLGEFIENLFNKNKINGYKKFRDDSGTLKSSYKTKLCDFVINGNYTYDDLIFENKQLDDIVVNLYNFIKPKH